MRTRCGCCHDLPCRLLLISRNPEEPTRFPRCNEGLKESFLVIHADKRNCFDNRRWWRRRGRRRGRRSVRDNDRNVRDGRRGRWGRRSVRDNDRNVRDGRRERWGRRSVRDNDRNVRDGRRERWGRRSVRDNDRSAIVRRHVILPVGHKPAKQHQDQSNDKHPDGNIQQTATVVSALNPFVCLPLERIDIGVRFWFDIYLRLGCHCWRRGGSKRIHRSHSNLLIQLFLL